MIHTFFSCFYSLETTFCFATFDFSISYRKKNCGNHIWTPCSRNRFKKRRRFFAQVYTKMMWGGEGWQSEINEFLRCIENKFITFLSWLLITSDELFKYVSFPFFQRKNYFMKKSPHHLVVAHRNTKFLLHLHFYSLTTHCIKDVRVVRGCFWLEKCFKIRSKVCNHPWESFSFRFLAIVLVCMLPSS